jgi:hypothetical protein
MSSRILPAFDHFIATILKEDPVEYLNAFLRADLIKLDEAILAGHSLAFEKRLARHKELYAMSAKQAMAESNPPSKPLRLDHIEVESACPVCDTKLEAYWDIEADFDEHGVVGTFPDPKLLLCTLCGFYIDGMEIGKYLPDGLEPYFRDYEWGPDEEY